MSWFNRLRPGSGGAEPPTKAAPPPARAADDAPPPAEASRPSAASSTSPFVSSVIRELSKLVSELNALALLKSCAASLGLQRDQLEPKHLSAILTQARLTFDFFGIPPERRDQCLDQLRALSGAERTQARADDMVTMAVEDEQDIVRARLAGKALCQRLGFSEVGTTKVMTAISELARNMHNYAGRGVIHIRRMNAEKPCIQVIATDRGPGIPDVEKVLSASYRSKSGMGLGLRGTRAIMDYFDIFSRPGEGTIVTVRKNLS